MHNIQRTQESIWHKRQKAQLRNNDVRNLLICAIEQNSTTTSAASAEQLDTSVTTVRQILNKNLHRINLKKPTKYFQKIQKQIRVLSRND